MKVQIEAALNILNARFKKVPSSTSTALNQRTDLTAMKSKVVVLAATCQSLEEFEAALK
jgi:hypothetical protein